MWRERQDSASDILLHPPERKLTEWMGSQSKAKLCLIGVLAVVVIAALTGFGVRQRIKRRKMVLDHEIAVESDELLAWLRREGGKAEAVRLQNFDHAGDAVRGLGATAAIAKGTEVLRVPRSLFIQAGGNDRHRGSYEIELLPQELDKQEALLAAEIGKEFKEGSDSEYARYLEALPSKEELETFHPFYATNEDLALFSDLPTAEDARKQRMILHDAWNKKRHGNDDSTGLQWEGDFSWPEFLHFFVLQESRRLELKLKRGGDENETTVLAVVPIADMINYAADPVAYEGGAATNVVHELVDGGEALVVRASRDIGAGEQLFLPSALAKR